MSYTSTQDFDRAMEAFLEPGPDRISSRLAMSIADAVHVTPRPRLAWRNHPTARKAAAFALLAAILGVMAFAFAVAIGPPPAPHPTPTPTPTSTPQPSSDTARNAVGQLDSGVQYKLEAFSVPLRFTAPRDTSISVVADSAGPHQQRLLLADGAITFHDGTDTARDLCHPDRGVLGAFASTPHGVGAWLRSTEGLSVSQPMRLHVDGGVAVSWDVSLAADCYLSPEAPPGVGMWFQRHERHRIYAIPTGSKVIVLFTWPSGYHGEGEDVLRAVNQLADQIVESMTFE